MSTYSDGNMFADTKTFADRTPEEQDRILDRARQIIAENTSLTSAKNPEMAQRLIADHVGIIEDSLNAIKNLMQHL